MYWLLGFFNEHGYFQMKWENRIYMNHPDVQSLPFDGNHSRVSGRNVEQTRIGKDSSRDGLECIADYRGPSQREPEEFRPSIGRFVISIMESKYRKILKSCCNSFSGDFNQTRLGGKGNSNHLVHQWSHNSTATLSRIDLGHDNAEDIEDTTKTLDNLLLYKLDGYNHGIFTHSPLPPEPRTDTWEPVDDGIGDPLIGRPRQRRGFVAPAPAHRNAGRKAAPKKSGGLQGSGAGGAGEAPDWFTNWLFGEGDKETCDLLVQGAREVGLEITEIDLYLKKRNDGQEEKKQSISKESKVHQGSSSSKLSKASSESSSDGKALAGSSNNSKESKAPPEISSDGKALAGSSNSRMECRDNSCRNVKVEKDQTSSSSKIRDDALEELRGPNFVSDWLINLFFTHLSNTYGGDGFIEFVDANIAHLLAHGDPNEVLRFNLLLPLPLYTVFAVNDNVQHEYGENQGYHWSLLVVDSSGAQPRFVHHDSFGGANSEAAQLLVERLRLVIPNAQEGVVEAATPLQGNGWDCAIFVMAMARSVARWWAHGDVEEDWIVRLNREVNSLEVGALRLRLVDLLLGNISHEDLEEDN